MTSRLEDLKARGRARQSSNQERRPLVHKKRVLDNIDDTDLIGSYGLTGKQYAFVVEYIKDPSNHAAAARRAGYTSATQASGVRAAKLMKDPKILAAISDLRERLLENVEVTPEQIIKRLAEIGFNTHPKPTAGDQIKALELLSKWLGVDTSGENGRVEIHVSFEKQSDSYELDAEDAEIVSETIDVVEADS